jgi:signal transduction histidine kinase
VVVAMKEQTAIRLAWAWWLLTIGLLVLAVVLGLLSHGVEPPDWFSTAILIGMTGFATVGALIASRHPRNPIGWLFSAIAFGVVLLGFRETYVVYALFASPGSLPGATFVAWLGSWIPLLAITSIPFVFLLFPDGSPPSKRWRLVGWIALAGMGLLVLGNIVAPGPLGGFNLGRVHIANPTGIQGLRGVSYGVLTVGAICVLVAGVASVIALVLRFRRSRGEERQQLRWLAYVAAATAAIPLIGIASAIAGIDLGNIVFPAFFLLLLIGIPVASGIAILKYRVLDLDIVIKKTVVFAVVATVLTGLYLGVIALATVGTVSRLLVGALLLAVTFNPVRRAARSLADRVVYGKRATSYEVLAQFSGRMADTYATDDVLPRMAQILAGATGASSATVWLLVGGELRPAASNGDAPVRNAFAIRADRLPELPDDFAGEVRHQGELLGALSVSMPVNDPLDPGREKLVRDLASQAGLVLRNVRLIEELRASRQRLVAAQDEERRKIERNIHDGAQQQLVALAVKQRMVASVVGRNDDRARAILEELQSETTQALEDLRDLARGVYPPLLADQGLAAALEAQARKSTVPVDVMADGVARFPQEVEVAVYFSCLEALQNVVKYAEASGAAIRLANVGGELTFEVEDDGVGFDASSTGYGTGLQGMADRLDALGGRIDVRSARGSGTTITGVVPVAATSATP